MQLLHVSQNPHIKQHAVINMLSKQRKTNRNTPKDPQERRRRKKKTKKTGKGNHKTSNGEIRPAVPMSSNQSSQRKKQVNKNSIAQVAFLPGTGHFEIILQTEPTKGRNAPTVFSHSPQFLTP